MHTCIHVLCMYACMYVCMYVKTLFKIWWQLELESACMPSNNMHAIK